MPKKNSNVAILFFTRSAEAEGMHKQFVNDTNRGKNVGLARSLIGHTRQQLSQMDLPVCEINEKNQKGSSFGERFANAFSEVFQKGYQYVIAVGNDTPELQPSHLNKARELLTEGKAQIVLGPAKDGGTWLMGYYREAFDHRSFQQLPWNSSRLLQTILERAGKEVAISQLEVFSDIDNYKALSDFVNQSQFTSSSILLIVRLILDILSADPTESTSSTFLTPNSPAQSSLFLRAPPLVV